MAVRLPQAPGDLGLRTKKKFTETNLWIEMRRQPTFDASLASDVLKWGLGITWSAQPFRRSCVGITRSAQPAMVDTVWQEYEFLLAQFLTDNLPEELPNPESPGRDQQRAPKLRAGHV